MVLKILQKSTYTTVKSRILMPCKNEQNLQLCVQNLLVGEYGSNTNTDKGHFGPHSDLFILPSEGNYRGSSSRN